MWGHSTISYGELTDILECTSDDVQRFVEDQDLNPVIVDSTGHSSPFRLGNIGLYKVSVDGAVTSAVDQAKLGILRFENSDVERFAPIWFRSVRRRTVIKQLLRQEVIEPPVDAVTLAVFPKDTSKPNPEAPLPLSTADVAFCFNGLQWKSEQEWKAALGKKKLWLQACCVSPGTRGRGGSPKLWNPVLIGAALVSRDYVKPNSVRAKFRVNHLLRPWFESWKDYEADNFSTE